jgi:hypothetical protein
MRVVMGEEKDEIGCNLRKYSSVPLDKYHELKLYSMA